MLENLMKMAGIDPDSIKKSVADASARFNEVIAHFNRRFDLQDARLDRIEALLNPPKQIEKADGFDHG